MFVLRLPFLHDFFSPLEEFERFSIAIMLKNGKGILPIIPQFFYLILEIFLQFGLLFFPLRLVLLAIVFVLSVVLVCEGLGFVDALVDLLDVLRYFGLLLSLLSCLLLVVQLFLKH